MKSKKDVLIYLINIAKLAADASWKVFREDPKAG